MTCNKCHQVPARDGDTWCLGCSSWESLGLKLTSHWSCSGSRRLAEDIVLSATRQVRFLRSLTAAIRTNAQAEAQRLERPLAAGKRAREETQEREERPVLQRKKDSRPGPPLGLAAKSKSEKNEKKEPSETEEVFEEETEEEEEAEVSHRPLGGSGDRRPPEPKGPPPSRPPPVAAPSKETRRKPEGERRRHRSDHGGQHQKNRHRGGRKHQRIGRLEERPDTPIHRKLSSQFLSTLSSEDARFSLDLVR